MNIGFDAKRVFYNRSGLGNYGRNIINTLLLYGKDLHLTLYTPLKKNPLIKYNSGPVAIVHPNNTFFKIFGFLWRTFHLKKQIEKDKLDIFHGLSNELPHNIHHSHIKSVVTIHDLIFLRYPKLYKPVDRYIYNKKFRYACRAADRIIAISEQTKQDIIEFYKIDGNKIDVVYQGCNPLFYNKWSTKPKQMLKEKYKLPNEFLLTVGTIEKRKNLLTTVKAIHEGKIDMPLVVVGKLTKYLEKVKEYTDKYSMQNIHILNYVPLEDLPGIYQLSCLFIYPSVFEGFGIPVLEALNSGVPVITTNYGCFKEAGGKAAVYINPENADEMANKIKEILNNTEKQKMMMEEGFKHAQNFREKTITINLLKVYNTAINHA